MVLNNSMRCQKKKKEQFYDKTLPTIHISIIKDFKCIYVHDK